MSKKKKQKEKIAKKATNAKDAQTKETVNPKEEIKGKEKQTPLTAEELLAIEKDKNLRLFAEFENFRKRTAKERIELFSTANKDIMTVLLPILDNFERSIKANNYSEEDGPVLIFKQLKSELEKINKDVSSKFGMQNNLNKKIEELNQETETLIDEIEKWQT